MPDIIFYDPETGGAEIIEDVDEGQLVAPAALVADEIRAFVAVEADSTLVANPYAQPIAITTDAAFTTQAETVGETMAFTLPIAANARDIRVVAIERSDDDGATWELIEDIVPDTSYTARAADLDHLLRVVIELSNDDDANTLTVYLTQDAEVEAASPADPSAIADGDWTMTWTGTSAPGHRSGTLAGSVSVPAGWQDIRFYSWVSSPINPMPVADTVAIAPGGSYSSAAGGTGVSQQAAPLTETIYGALFYRENTTDRMLLGSSVKTLTSYIENFGLTLADSQWTYAWVGADDSGEVTANIVAGTAVPPGYQFRLYAATTQPSGVVLGDTEAIVPGTPTIISGLATDAIVYVAIYLRDLGDDSMDEASNLFALPSWDSLFDNLDHALRGQASIGTIPSGGHTVSRNVGGFVEDRLVWVFVGANAGFTVAINGAVATPVYADSEAGVSGKLYASETEAADVAVTVTPLSGSLSNTVVGWYTTVGYDSTPTDTMKAGVSASNTTSASGTIDLEADGLLLAFTRHYNAITAPASPDTSFSGGAASWGLGIISKEYPGGSEALTVTGARNGGLAAIGGKAVFAFALSPDGGTPPPPPPPIGEVVTTVSATSATGGAGFFTANFGGTYQVFDYMDGTKGIYNGGANVSVTSYTPAVTTIAGGFTVRGAMKNVTPDKRFGFDSRAGQGFSGQGAGAQYLVARNVGLSLPITLAPGDTLILSDYNSASYGDTALYASSGGSKNVLKRVGVFHCVGALPLKQPYRPTYYVGAPYLNLTFANVNTALLRNLTPPPNPPSWATVASDNEQHGLTVAYPYFDLWTEWDRNACVPSDHIGGYGRGLCSRMGQAAALLNCNYTLTEKRSVLDWLLQAGMDAWGLMKARQALGRGLWVSDGGHNHGRMLAIYFAGHMFDRDEMKSAPASIAGQTSWPHGFVPELVHFRHVDQAVVDATNAPGWATSYPYYPDRPGQPYSEEMIGAPDFMIAKQAGSQNAHWNGHAYREMQATYWGWAIALLAMGIAPGWGDTAIFDHHVRMWHCFNGLADPFRTQFGYASVGGADSGGAATAAYRKYWEQPWAYQMFGAHYRAFYQFPWE